jgi:hypothetical protein
MVPGPAYVPSERLTVLLRLSIWYGGLKAPVQISHVSRCPQLVNSAGIITLGKQVIQVGSPLAGQRARIRLDGQIMHVITQDGTLWRTLPCPIPPAQRHKLQGVRLAGPELLPPAALVVQRKVSSRGGIQVAGQRPQVGFLPAGQPVTIDSATPRCGSSTSTVNCSAPCRA